MPRAMPPRASMRKWTQSWARSASPPEALTASAMGPGGPLDALAAEAPRCTRNGPPSIRVDACDRWWSSHHAQWDIQAPRRGLHPVGQPRVGLFRAKKPPRQAEACATRRTPYVDWTLGVAWQAAPKPRFRSGLRTTKGTSIQIGAPPPDSRRIVGSSGDLCRITRGDGGRHSRTIGRVDSGAPDP